MCLMASLATLLTMSRTRKLTSTSIARALSLSSSLALCSEDMECKNREATDCAPNSRSGCLCFLCIARGPGLSKTFEQPTAGHLNLPDSNVILCRLAVVDEGVPTSTTPTSKRVFWPWLRTHGGNVGLLRLALDSNVVD